MKKSGFMFISSLLMWTVTAYASQPTPPQLSLNFDSKVKDECKKIKGVGTAETGNALKVMASWEKVKNVEGYRLFYATYPNFFGRINRLDLGPETLCISTTLQNGEGYYVAVQAYNKEGTSEFSNVEHFLLDRKIVALLPLTGAGNNEGNSIKAGLEKAINDNIWAKHEQQVRWVVVDTRSDFELLKTLYYGSTTTDMAWSGYLNDPNVLAIVTSSTSNSVTLISRNLENHPLIIAGSATSTILQGIDGLLTLPPSNKIQAETVYKKLSEDAKRYVVVLDSNIRIVVYSFDLYFQLLQEAFDREVIGRKLTPRLMGTLVFNGSNAETVVTTLKKLGAETVFYMGRSAYFKMLYDQCQALLGARQCPSTWIGANGIYDYENFKDSQMMVVTPSGEDTTQNIVAYSGQGYDAVGFLTKVIDGVLDDSKELTRENILEKAKETTYEGCTGDKGFSVEETKTGQYEILKVGKEHWEKVEINSNSPTSLPKKCGLP